MDDFRESGRGSAMRILCLIPAMGTAGGAQRVMAHLATQFARRHDVTLMTWDAVQSASFYPLPESIRTVRADLLGGSGQLDRALRILSRFVAIRRQVRSFRPHVVLSFMDTMNIATIIGCAGSGVPVVVSERVDPLHYDIGTWKSFVRRWLYPAADCCVVQTERVKAFFKRPPSPRLHVIPNPIPIPAQQARPDAPSREGRFRIIGLGRLAPQKGYDLLLEAFARLAPAHPDWDLVIFGEGPARAELESQVERLRLGGRVHLPGVTADPAIELAASHIMAFPSRFEGFPNALAEGLAAGLPAIGHRGVSGVEELILNNETGLLVDPYEGASALIPPLQRLMDDPSFRVRVGAKARLHVEQWRVEAICERWEACLAGVARKGEKLKA